MPQRDSQGRFTSDRQATFSRMEALSRQHELQAAQFGKQAHEQTLVAIEKMVAHDTPAVQTYMASIVHLVQTHMDSTRHLQQVEPLLVEAETAVKKDRDLTDSERKRITGYIEQIRHLIASRTSLASRARRRLAGVTLPDVRGGLASAAAAGASGHASSFTFGALARVLTRGESRGGREQDATQSFHEGAAEVLGSIAARGGSQPAPASKRVSSSRGHSGMDFVPDIPLPRKKAQAPTIVQGKGKNKTAPSEPESHEGLRTQNKILDELVDIHDILRKDLELRQNKDEATEISEGESTAKATRLGKGAKLSSDKSATENIVAAAGDKLKTLMEGLGLGELGGLIGKSIIPALTLLGEGALVIGAAFAGWKVGEWIDKMTGASNVVQHAAEYISHKLFGTPPTEHQQAQDQTMTQVNSARTLSKGRLKNPTPQQASDFLKARSDALAKGLRGDAAIDAALQHTQSVTPTVPAPTPNVAPAPSAAAVVPDIAATSPLRLNNIPQMTANFGPPAAPSTSPVRAPSVMTQTQQMHMSSEGLQKLLKSEGGENTRDKNGDYVAYRDLGGVWTIGHGLTTVKGKAVTPGMRLSPAEDQAEVKRRIATEFEPMVKKALHGTPVNQHVFDALVDTAYNSPKAMRGLATKIVNGKTLTAADFEQSATIHGKASHGLQNRRLSEFSEYAENQPTLTPATPSDVRSTPGVGTLAGTAPAPSVTVVAPQTTVAQTSGQSNLPPMIMPIPIQTENPDVVLRALKGINGV